MSSSLEKIKFEMLFYGLKKSNQNKKKKKQLEKIQTTNGNMVKGN